MTKDDTSGPAFPISSDVMGHNSGMTLRDWFAGQALIGIIAHPSNKDPNGGASFAKTAYMLADAMIKARKVQE